MGRSKKAETIVVALRVTLVELAKWKVEAKDAGLSIGAYIRSKVDNCKQIPNISLQKPEKGLQEKSKIKTVQKNVDVETGEVKSGPHPVCRISGHDHFMSPDGKTIVCKRCGVYIRDV